MVTKGRRGLMLWLTGFVGFLSLLTLLSVHAQEFEITSVTMTNNDVRIAWNAEGQSNYVVQVGVTAPSGGFTNAFMDLSPLIVVPGFGWTVTNYLHVGGALITPSRFYRVQSFSNACPPPANDNFADRIALVGSTVEAGADTTCATKETDEPDHAGNAGGKSVWWSWTAPANGTVVISTCGSNFDTLLAVYTGTAVNALTEVASNDDACSFQSRVHFTAVSGTTYQIAVDGYGGESGDVVLSISYPPVPPNDNFANRIVLAGSSLITAGSTLNASKEAGEPDHAGDSGGNSVWWSWTAPSTGPVIISACDSEFDTLLAVYTGTAVNALTPVTSNNDFCDLQSQVQFMATAGTTYQIAVDGSNGAAGTVSLGITYLGPTPSDNFASRPALSGPFAIANGNNSLATKEGGEPNHAGNAGDKSVWWSWTAPATGMVTIETCGSGFDTLLGIYTGTAVNALTEVDSNDDFCDLQSRVQFLAASGTMYQIAVDGFNAASGNIVLTIRQ